MRKITKAKQAQLDRALAVLEEHVKYSGVNFHSAAAANQYFVFKLGMLEHEEFHVAYLTSQHELIECERLFRGSISACQVFPREIAKRALELNAAAVILAHNHPSGIGEPSRADIDITHQVEKALDLFDIRTLDHFIVGGTTTTSLAERGYL